MKNLSISLHEKKFILINGTVINNDYTQIKTEIRKTAKVQINIIFMVRKKQLSKLYFYASTWNKELQDFVSILSETFLFGSKHN